MLFYEIDYWITLFFTYDSFHWLVDKEFDRYECDGEKHKQISKDDSGKFSLSD